MVHVELMIFNTSTLMIKSYGFTSQQSFLLSMPAGGLQLVIGWGIPYLASRTGQRALMAIVCMLLGLFGIALMTGLAKDDPLNARVGQLFAYYLMIPSPSTALILIITSVGTNAGTLIIEKWRFGHGALTWLQLATRRRQPSTP